MLPNPTSKKFGLALGSGSSRGLAHIGVIKALCHHRIPIDIITGSSAGALVGGFYSVWQDIDRLEKFTLDLNYRKLISIFIEPLNRQALFRGKKMLDFINENLGHHQIENLDLTFRAVATNALTADTYIFDQGDLGIAIRSSCSIPLVFQPVKYEGMVLIDGGASCPIPAQLARLEGADIVLAVNLYHGLFPQDKITTFGHLHLILNNLAKENLKYADFVVEPITKGTRMLDFVAAKKLIEIGYQSTLPLIPQIKSSLGL